NRDATNATGLGPVFNERSCSDCHNAPASGGGSGRVVTRFARRVNGAYDPLTALGGSLLQDHAIGGGNGSQHNYTPERVPAEATIVVRRRTTPLYGLGLVDATPDADFIALAAAEAARGDGVVGRVNMTDNIRAGTKTVGRFGWKAQVPTLFQFAGDALVNEIGVTTPDFPNENCPQGNCAELTFNPAPGINDTGNGPLTMTDFMLMLAAPNRGPQTPDSIAGEQLFQSVGCGACHTATLTSGSSPIASLDHQTYHPYSDFLLHDMGSLGDDLEMASSSGTEMRTEPLWGLRFINRYLHDARATTLEQAIGAHDGQGAASRDRFAALTASAKAQLVAFLRSL
ncbi:MAG TPA: di-heme oxidoredictase family protein, partial [Thermoanaerobaculia bacterium]|nr:di-heme oxidoredictase family protein [Thermoanaerobaculia bacterium]